MIFTHLSYAAIESCSEVAIKIANFVNYLSSKSIVIYEKCSNLMMKSFAEGLIQYVNRLTAEFTDMLTQLQQESGQLKLIHPQNN